MPYINNNLRMIFFFLIPHFAFFASPKCLQDVSLFCYSHNNKRKTHNKCLMAIKTNQNPLRACREIACDFFRLPPSIDVATT